jgi:hypothetical protein
LQSGAIEKEHQKNESTSSEAELQSDLSQDESDAGSRSKVLGGTDLDPNAFIVDFMHKNKSMSIVYQVSDVTLSSFPIF